MPKWAKLLSLASVAAAVLVVIMTPLTSLADGQWSAVSTLTPRLRYAVTTVGSKVLIAGGEKYVGGREGIAYFVQVDIYDSATGNWSSATLAEPRSGMVAATVGSKALLYGRRGGLDYVDTVDIYDSESDTWSVTHLPDVVNLPAMFTVRDQVIVLGTPKTPGADIANVYDTTTDTWTSTQLPDRPIDPIALVAGDVALVGTGAGGAWDTLDLFDATTRQWSTVKLSQARSSPSTAIAGSLILIAGGSTDGRPSDVVDIYDASTRSLTSAHLSEARIVGTSAVANGHVIFAGGSNKHMEKVDNSFVERGGASDVVDIFTVVTGEWSVSKMPHSAYQPQAVAVGTHALFAGITTSGPTDATPVDIYDSTTGSWTSATLSDARQNLRAVTVGNQALFLGGSFPGRDRSLRQNSDVVDIYDEPIGTWTPGHLQAGREVRQVAVVGLQAVVVGGVRGCQGCDGGQLDPIVDIYSAGS